MTRISLISLAGVLALSACSSSKETIGMWVFQIGDGNGDEKSTCEENFEDASCASDDVESDWVITDDWKDSDGVFTVRVFETAGEGAVLAYDSDFGRVLLPGTIGRDAASFEWTWSSDGNNTASYKSDYAYTYTDKTTQTLTFELSRDNKTGLWTGTRTEQTTSIQEWTESDTWDEDVFPFTSMQNGADLLTGDDEDDFPFGVSNTRDDEECGGKTCSVKVSSTTTLTSDVTAWRIDNVGLVDDQNFTEFHNEPGAVH